MKKMCVFLLVLLFYFSVFVFAEELASKDWVKRFEIAANWETSQKPSFFLQTVQPLNQNLDGSDVLFMQPRVSINNGEATYNFGLGRRIILSEELLLGFNIFGDYKNPHDHGRIGFGSEAIGQQFEARVNSYFGITPTRRVDTNNSSDTYERVADGYDVEVGSSVPFIPWMKVYGSIFEYDYKKSKDRQGWKVRNEIELNDAITIEGYVWDDNKGDKEYGVELRLKLFFDGLFDFRESFKFSKAVFPKKDLRDEILKPVVRNHDIVVEKWIEDKSGAIIVRIGRAS